MAQELLFTTESAEAFTGFIRDVVPQVTTTLASRPHDVQAQVRSKITDTYRRFEDADGRVRTTNQSIWVRAEA